MDGGERRPSLHETPREHNVTPTSSHEFQMGVRPQERYGADVQSSGTPVYGSTYQGRRTSSVYGTFDYQQAPFPSSQLHNGGMIQDVGMQYQHYGHAQSGEAATQQPTPQQQLQTFRQGSMLPPMQRHSLYGSLPQYRARESGAADAAASQYTPSTYLPPTDNTTHVGTSQFGLPQGQPSLYSNLPITHVQMPPTFAESSSVYNIYQGSNILDSTREERQGTAHNQPTLAEQKTQYEQQIKATFEFIIAGRLTQARDTILNATQWLVNSIVPLGLHHDDANAHEERLTMWTELNHCWEALGQRQNHLTQPDHRTTAETMTPESLIDLVNQFIAMCDRIEQHGLVDYQMGLWEEQIVAVYISCLDTLAANQMRSDRMDI